MIDRGHGGTVPPRQWKREGPHQPQRWKVKIVYKGYSAWIQRCCYNSVVDTLAWHPATVEYQFQGTPKHVRVKTAVLPSGVVGTCRKSLVFGPKWMNKAWEDL